MSRTVHVVVCADPIEGGDVWVHGVYESKATARRVFDHIVDETYHTVRITKARIRKTRQPRPADGGSPR